MKGQIKVGSGLKIKRTATISENAKVKETLKLTKYAIQQGKLDDVIVLDTWDRDEAGHVVNRIMTITELDQHIESIRQQKIDDMDFAITQMDLFSKYLKKNVHAAQNGYSAGMVLNFISMTDLQFIVDEVLKTKKEVEEKGFQEGQYNNMRGQPETLSDRITVAMDGKFHNNRLEDLNQ